MLKVSKKSRDEVRAGVSDGPFTLEEVYQRMDGSKVHALDRFGVPGEAAHAARWGGTGRAAAKGYPPREPREPREGYEGEERMRSLTH